MTSLFRDAVDKPVRSVYDDVNEIHPVCTRADPDPKERHDFALEVHGEPERHSRGARSGSAIPAKVMPQCEEGRLVAGRTDPKGHVSVGFYGRPHLRYQAPSVSDRRVRIPNDREGVGQDNAGHKERGNNCQREGADHWLRLCLPR